MSARTLRYARPSDNVAADATVSVQTGTADSEYPAANLVDLQPEKPAKLVETSGAWLFDFGGDQKLDAVALIHTNLDEGLEVRLQGNATDSWGAPTLNQTFTIPARFADLFPRNPWLHLADLFPTAGDRTFRFWRVVVVGTNTDPVWVGEVIMAETIRDLDVRDIKWDSQRIWNRPSVTHQTDLLVRHTYDYGTTVREFQCDIDPTDAVLAEVEDWFRDARGPSHPFLVLPRSEDENDAWFVTFLGSSQVTRRVTFDYTLSTLNFIEASRGLYP